MSATIEKLRQVVIDESKRLAGGILLSEYHPLTLAVRALERHEAREMRSVDAARAKERGR